MSDLRISGSGTLNAGNEYYEYVGISGSGVINGDLLCRELKISGSGKINGNITCDEEISISGSGKVMGEVRAARIYTAGSSGFEKNIKCDEFKIAGSSKIAGDIDCKKIKISGSASISNISAEVEADIRGAVNISGLLNAESVSVSLYNDCNINEIGCTNLKVSRNQTNDVNVKIFNFTLFSVNKDKGRGKLHSKIIEGDNIYLECTEAETVRGATVEIGPGCNIGRVEYTESLIVDDGSQVTEKIKI